MKNNLGKPLNLFTITPSGAFLPNLVEAICKGRILNSIHKDDASSIQKLTLILPTRRAIRLLEENWRQWSGLPALVKPKTRALGDLDDMNRDDFLGGPEVISPLERQFLLMPLIQKWASLQTSNDNKAIATFAQQPAGAFRLAEELAHTLDFLITEEKSLSELNGHIPNNLDDYWQKSADFLEIIQTHWPNILKDQGKLDQSTKRQQTLKSLTEQIKNNQSCAPIILAGSTGSVPATARLMGALARHPQGATILPGYDRLMNDQLFELFTEEKLDKDPAIAAHPQANMSRFLALCEARPGDVKILDKSTPQTQEVIARINMCFYPSRLTHQWHEELSNEKKYFEHITLVEAENLEQEAASITSIIAQEMHNGAQKILIITPDQKRSRRIEAHLSLNQIVFESSLGVTFAGSAEGRFAVILANAALNPTPSSIRAFLLHPMCCAAMPQNQRTRDTIIAQVLHGHTIRDWEDFANKTQRYFAPETPYKTLPEITDEDRQKAIELIETLSKALEPLLSRQGQTLPISHWAQAHASCIQNIKHETADIIGQNLLQIEAGMILRGSDYAQIIKQILSKQPLDRPYNTDAKVHIMGLPESRLLHADFVVLAGLNEAIWPSVTQSGAFLNRAYLNLLDILPPERRIGLAAHDFAQHLAQKKVLITRAKHEDGTTTKPSRFLERLRVISGDEWHEMRARGEKLRQSNQIITEYKDTKTYKAPKPTRSKRPTQYSISSLLTLQQDPYAFYAQNILGLSLLPKLGDESTQAQYGTLVHAVLQRVQSTQKTLEDYHQIFEQELHATDVDDFTKDLWRRRFSRSALWLAIQEAEYANERMQTDVEKPARYTFATSTGETVAITARADRIDHMKDGTYRLIDYKTGAKPNITKKDKTALSQLLLEAALLQNGAFGKYQATNISALEYWHLPAQEPHGERITHKKVTEIPERAQQMLTQAKNLIEHYLNPDQGYNPQPRKNYRRREYVHLSRAAQWISHEDEAQET